MDRLEFRDVLILAAIATITALFAGFLALGLGLAFGWTKPGTYSIATIAIVGACSWGYLIRWYQHTFEKANGIAPIVPEILPQQFESATIRIDYNEEHTGDYIGLGAIGITPDRFFEFLEGCAQGTSLGENHWTGRGNLFSKAEYHRLRNLLIKRGYLEARGRHHAQGYEWGRKGVALLNRFEHRVIQDNHSPTTRILAGSFDNYPALCVRERASVPLLEEV